MRQHPNPTDTGSTQTLPEAAAYSLLAVPVAWCDEQGRWCGANDAFSRFTGRQADADGHAPLPGDLQAGDALPAEGPGARLLALLQAGTDADDLPWHGDDGRGRALAGTLSLRCHGSWRIVTLLPQPVAATAAAVAADADEQPSLPPPFDVALHPLSFGNWSIDLRTGERHWDAQVWRFWGLVPRPGAPSQDDAAVSVHPEDRDETIAIQRRSLLTPGRYTHRFRVVQPDGEVQRLRSLWHVASDAEGKPVQVTGILIDDSESFRLAQSADDAQSQLNLVLALADIAIWEHDRASGMLRTSTLGWALLGLPALPQGLPLALAADQLEAPGRQALQRLLQSDDVDDEGDNGQSDELELRCRRPDGQWRALLVRSVRQRDGQGGLRGHVGVMLDLSDRFAAQQQALALAHRLEMATAAAGVGVWSVALSEPPRAHWDTQMRRLHGLPPDAPAPLLTHYLAEHVHAADRASAQQNLDVLMQRNEGLLDLDLRIQRPDGQVRRLATRTSVSRIDGQRQLHGVMLDVTDRHLAEDRLREAAERAALAARGAGLGTWESNSQSTESWWDAQMFRLRGLDSAPGMVPHEQMYNWLHPADRDAHRRLLQSAENNEESTNTEFRVVWPDGTVRWLASRSTPVRDERGRAVRRIGINWDITDARNAEAARQERLLAQRENQAKARFLARISHELRTPMNAVLGFSQLLLAETAEGQAPDPATWRSRVNQVQSSGEHLLALIDDVLELSSLESGELPLSLQPLALAPLVQTSLPLVELLAKQHQVSLEVGALDGWVLADPVRLRQVLVNLLSNAIKYNRPGGRVTIDAMASEGWWLLQVEDTGRGMSPEQLQHLFEPFNRLGAERDGIAGTGIGLAIVQAAVQHMGGTVQVRSTPGVGSVFELALQQTAPSPQVTVDIEPGAPVPAARAPTCGARPLLLYIEDNEVNMLIVRELMAQRPDLDFEGAPDGDSGLRLARELQPALVLLDMQLPDMDGHAVLRALRDDPATAAIRCIALSANAMPEDIRTALAEGFDDYWTKPLDLTGFLRSLDRLFGPATGGA